MVVPRLSMSIPLCPPIGIAYLAGSLRKANLDVRCVDALGEAPFQHIVLDNPNFVTYGLSVAQIAERVGTADVIGISVIFSNGWPLAKTIAQAVRKNNPGALIVLGGEHVTAVPEFCLEDCPEADVCVRGEGEETLIELVSAHEQGRALASVRGIVFRGPSGASRTEKRARIRTVEQIPWPAWDLVPIETYLDNEFGYGINPGRTIPLVATRGCPYQCTFCSSPQMWTTLWRPRDPEDVLREIGHYIEHYGAQNVDFYDLTAVINRDWLVKFCNGIIERKWKITWQMPAGTRSEILDAEVLALMRDSGVNFLTYAPESGSEETLKLIKKKIGLTRMVSSMRAAVKCGIKVKMNLIFGFPHETHRQVIECFSFIKDAALIGVHDAVINSFAPYPGSELFKQLYQEGKVRDGMTGRQITVMDESYFLSLAHELTNAESYSAHMSSRALTFYKLAGLTWFYGLSFLVRPYRLLRLIINLITRKEETRLDASLGQIRNRLFNPKVAVKSGA